MTDRWKEREREKKRKVRSLKRFGLTERNGCSFRASICMIIGKEEDEEARRVKRIKGETPLRFPRWLSRFSGPDLKFRPRYLRITRGTGALLFSRVHLAFSPYLFRLSWFLHSSTTFTNLLILTSGELKIFDFADVDIRISNRSRENSKYSIQHSIDFLILLNGFKCKFYSLKN